MKRICNNKECKIIKCIHHGEHIENTFCDDTCDTFFEAKCIKKG